MIRVRSLFPIVVVLAVLAVVVSEQPATATFPGGNGAIIYAGSDGGPRGTSMFMADPGGTNVRKVWDDNDIFQTWGPQFSPQGGTVAYGLYNTFVPGITFINVFDTAGAAGAPCGPTSTEPLCNPHTLASFPTMLFYEQPAAWSPDGSQLAVAAPDGIWVIDYLEARECTDIPCQEAARTKILSNVGDTEYDQPAWQPGGSLLAVRITEDFTGAYSIRYDIGTVPSTGGEVTHLNLWDDDPGLPVVENGCEIAMPNWSPDGEEIAYETGDCFRPITTTMHLPPFGPITYQQIPASGIAVVSPGGPWHRITPVSEGNAYSFIGQTDPVWAPDESRILYYGNCTRSGSPVTGICAVSPDGEQREYWGELGPMPDWSTGEGTRPNAFFDATKTGGSVMTHVQRGGTIDYHGEGWEDGGPPIKIKWAGQEVDSISPATAAFVGTFEAPDFPEYDSRLASLGQAPCQADVTATQGGIHRILHASGDPGEVVYKAEGAVTRFDGGQISFGQSISCKGGVFLAEGDIPLTAGAIGENICDDPDITQQFLLVTTSVAGRARDGALDQVDPYPGFWVQYKGPHGECIDANGIFADQLWIGNQLIAAGQALGSAPDFLTEVDLASGAYTRRQPTGTSSANGHIVHFKLAVPPPGDENMNGVDDELEISPEAFDRQFHDLIITTQPAGRVLIEDNVAIRIVRDPETNGLEITTFGTPWDVNTGEENVAEMLIYDEYVRMHPGDKTKWQRGAGGGGLDIAGLFGGGSGGEGVSVTVVEGSVEVLMGANTGVLLPQGADATITPQGGDTFGVANNAGSTASISLVAEGTLTPLAPGDAEQATVLALKGDIDCGGTIGMLDAIELIRLLNGLLAEASDLCPQSAAAQRNIDCAGGTTAKDVLLLVQYVADAAAALPGGCAPLGQFPPQP